jgi:hypothetical protein
MFKIASVNGNGAKWKQLSDRDEAGRHILASSWMDRVIYRLMSHDAAT